MNILDKLFSSKYVNKSAVKNNIVVSLIGRFSYPFSFIFSKIGVTPNQITTLSIILAIASAISLAISDNWQLFIWLWSISLLLDFCDGTLARMTSQTRKTAFRYDHTSDLFKIFVIILGVSIKYDDIVLWGAAISTIFLLLLHNSLNCELRKAKEMAQEKINFQSIISEKKYSFKGALKRLLKNQVIMNIYILLFTISGHTLLLFLLFSSGRFITLYVLVYLSIISFYGSLILIIKLKNINNGAPI